MVGFGSNSGARYRHPRLQGRAFSRLSRKRGGRAYNFFFLELAVGKRIGIKYCGGCNPTYERVEMILRVKARFNDQFLFLRYNEPDIDTVILVSGCRRACAGQDLNPKEIPHWSVMEENDLENLIKWLTSLREKGDPQ